MTGVILYFTIKQSGNVVKFTAYDCRNSTLYFGDGTSHVFNIPTNVANMEVEHTYQDGVYKAVYKKEKPIISSYGRVITVGKPKEKTFVERVRGWLSHVLRFN